MDKYLVIKPRVSEKAYALSQLRNTYVVQVPASANKHTVASAMTAQFDVVVEEVNIINVKGKPKRTVRKGGRPTFGKRSDVKKAYVTLKSGQTLPFFAEAEKAEAKADAKELKKGEEKK